MNYVIEAIIESRRKDLELSQDEISKRLGISRQYYNAIENHRRTPSVTLAKELGRILGFEWSIFFEDKVNK